MIKPRVVLDTNVYLSAIIYGGIPRKVLNLAIKEKFHLFTSTAILLEISLKLKTKFLWPETQVNEVIKAIADIAFVIKPKTKLKVVKKDPTDNKILETALASQTNFIVTGDSHLLELKSYKGIKIIKSGEFVRIITNNHKFDKIK